MSITLHNNARIVPSAKHVSHSAVTLVCGFGGEHFVVCAGEEEDGDVFETVQVVWGGERREERAVGGYVPVVAHAHEEVEEGHVDAAEEAVDLAVGGFV